MPSWDEPVTIYALPSTGLDLPPPVMTPLVFLARFTVEERLAITATALTSAPLMLWFLTAMGARELDLSDPMTVAGVQALVDAGHLRPSRAEEILHHG